MTRLDERNHARESDMLNESLMRPYNWMDAELGEALHEATIAANAGIRLFESKGYEVMQTQTVVMPHGSGYAVSIIVTYKKKPHDYKVTIEPKKFAEQWDRFDGPAEDE